MPLSGAGKIVHLEELSDQVAESVFEQDYVTVAPVKGSDAAEFVGKDLKSAIAEALDEGSEDTQRRVADILRKAAELIRSRDVDLG